MKVNKAMLMVLLKEITGEPKLRLFVKTECSSGMNGTSVGRIKSPV